MKYLLLLGLLLLCGCSTLTEPTATAPETTEGKITQKYADVTVSRLLRVIDGDTFACDIDTHSPIAGKNISIRLRGINTPELRDKDPALRKSAYEEKERLERPYGPKAASFSFVLYIKRVPWCWADWFYRLRRCR